jgi:hypothetical protein
MAAKMFNSFHTFPFDYWQTWLINDIVRNIKKCEDRDSMKDRLTIAKEHTNLAKAIGRNRCKSAATFGHIGLEVKRENS